MYTHRRCTCTPTKVTSMLAARGRRSTCRRGGFRFCTPVKTNCTRHPCISLAQSMPNTIGSYLGRRPRASTTHPELSQQESPLDPHKAMFLLQAVVARSLRTSQHSHRQMPASCHPAFSCMFLARGSRISQHTLAHQTTQQSPC